MAVPRILIVDDFESCEILSDTLKEYGFQVDVAHDGSGALDMVQSKKHSVAVVASNLPDMDGLNLYRRLQESSQSIGVVLVTPVPCFTSLKKGVDAGMLDVLSKPINVERLVSRIEEFAEKPVPALENAAHRCNILS